MNFSLAIASRMGYIIDVKEREVKPKPKEQMMNDMDFVKILLKGLVIIFTVIGVPFTTMFACAAFGVGIDASVILVFASMGLVGIPFICLDWI